MCVQRVDFDRHERTRCVNASSCRSFQSQRWLTHSNLFLEEQQPDDAAFLQFHGPLKLLTLPFVPHNLYNFAERKLESQSKATIENCQSCLLLVAGKLIFFSRSTCWVLLTCSNQQQKIAPCPCEANKVRARTGHQLPCFHKVWWQAYARLPLPDLKPPVRQI